MKVICLYILCKSDLVFKLFDGVLQGEDVAEQRALQGFLQSAEPVAVGPLFSLHQLGLQPFQGLEHLLPLGSRH